MMLATGEFSIGRVFRLLPKVLGQESISLWLSFSALGVALDMLSFVLRHGLGAGGLGTRATVAVFSITVSVAACFVHCTAIHAADMRLNGTPVPAVEAFRDGFCRSWDYLALALLLGFVLIVGLLLLIVPGLFAGVVFSLALPALVIRQEGISGSMNISWTMTRGRRWRICGVWLVYGIVSFIVFAGITLLFLAVFYFVGFGQTAAQTLLLAVLHPVFTGVSLVVGGAVSATMFRMIEADSAP